MAIDYYGLYPCKVREEISDDDLLRLVKARNYAEAVLDFMRNNPDVDKSKPESEWSFKTIVQGPDGTHETMVRISDLLADTGPLDRLAIYCTNCPANIQSRAFGCGGAIHYPITTQAERWLVSRLPNELESQAGKLLARGISDFGFDGKGIEAAHSRKELYEANRSEERKWGGFLNKTRVTSSQILHMSIGIGNLQPSHAKMIAYFLGFLNDDFTLSDAPVNLPQPGDDECIIELKLFYSVAAFAGMNNISMLVDA